MSILLLGGSGRTGLKVIEEAKRRSIAVTALVRYKRGPAATLGVEVLEGDALDPDSVRSALNGHRVIVSVLGPRTRQSQGLFANAARAAAKALSGSSVRYVCLSSALLYNGGGLIGSFFRWRLRDALADTLAMEEIVRLNLASWRIVRAPRLTDAPPSPSGTNLIADPTPNTRSVSRSDLAKILLDVALDEREHTGVLGIRLAGKAHG
ncbi:MAG TPA: NAD(P)H-binding protein [Verrucomicrobiae bacterium]|nr:NAD(P)H-binding protein [Verrucomicrobiae bacterium]